MALWQAAGPTRMRGESVSRLHGWTQNGSDPYFLPSPISRLGAVQAGSYRPPAALHNLSKTVCIGCTALHSQNATCLFAYT